MFPIEFDHRVLDSLPLTDEEDVKRVIQILKAVVARRVMPYFRKKRGTDPILIARVSDSLRIQRLEDDRWQVRGVSLGTRNEQECIIRVHERVFDYLAFVIPSDPQASLGAGTREERKMLAFAEFMLRHEIEHMLYPGRTEREVIQSGAAFAMDRRTGDPTFYGALRRALDDEMNGLRGEAYLALFDYAEQEHSVAAAVTRILNEYVAVLMDFPLPLLQTVLLNLDAELRTKVLGECYRRSRDTAVSLLRRTEFLKKLLGLFAILVSEDEKEAEAVFATFKGHWGLISLLRELEIPESSVEDKDPREIFEVFKESLKRFANGTSVAIPSVTPAPAVSPAEPKSTEAPVKSLKDRIDEARSDPTFPAQVMAVIDKNKLNAVGHSGSKYSELLEVLLAVPWGKMQEITVSPEEFEDGLNRTHYGLHKPKEMVCDFFSNLIWRCQQRDDPGSGPMPQSGSAFLFVGPPGVGKTSLAISIAENLGIPYHKLSLGGMRDEADLRGHGFTYEGSKPGAIVQGLIKMGAMNAMFIMDEADKMEKFAIATLLEILDPEQNHLFHDKYTQTTVDIDLSNCHFILTGNTLETVPPPVVNRCEVLVLDRYSVDEKISIAREHLIRRVRKRYQITEEQIFFDPTQETELLRHLVKAYTHEPGVRELERLIRTLFLRVLRKELLTGDHHGVRITREKIKQYLEPPTPPRQISEEDRIGETMALGVNVELGVGSIIPIQATPIPPLGTSRPQQGYLSMIHATGNIERIMDESRKVATTAIFYCAAPLGIDLDRAEAPIHLHFMGGSTPKDGPSAGGAIALALASVLSGRKIRRDIAMTGEIDTQGRITRIGGLDVKLETAYDAGAKTIIIPGENLHGEEGIERLSDALKRELQVLTYDTWKEGRRPFDYQRHVLQIVVVDNILQAADVAFINDDDLEGLEASFASHARSVAQALEDARQSQRQHFAVVYVKDPEDLTPEDGEDTFWKTRSAAFLVRPEAREAMLRRFPMFEHTLSQDFDPSSDDISAVLQELSKTFQDDSADLIHVSLIAPYFFMNRDSDRLQKFAADPQIGRSRLFGNNYTVQGVKIKRCKATLNRVFYHLSQLGPEHLDVCPFLGKRDNTHVVDLSVIPEKYRLDVKRAEKILNRALAQWLTIAEGNDSPADKRK